MIYISTACFKGEKIKDIIETIVKYGFRNIELSGGTKSYQQLESDLSELKEKYNLTYLIHNYFPPPENDFVLNLASADEKIYFKSIQQVQNALKLAEKINVTAIGIHAGFLTDPKTSELGNPFEVRNSVSKINGLNKFAEALNSLYKNLNKKIYIENNVLSSVNYKTYNNTNPFLLTCSEDYSELLSKVNFNLLLDIAHLKVTCKTLNLNFKKELSQLIDKTDYLHLSDNDGNTDSNNAFDKNSELYNLLSGFDLKNKTITLEIYKDIKGIISTQELLSNLQN